MEFRDRTDELLSSGEIKDALNEVTMAMLNIIKLPPELGVQLVTIRKALNELLVIRMAQESNT